MMKEKTSVKKPCAISVGTRANNTQPKKRFVLYWRVCEEKIALLSCVDEKVLIPMFITVGQRTLWKRVKSTCQAT